MFPISDVNFVAVIAATVVNMLLGMTWYSPGMFGAKWMKLTGMTEEKAKDKMGQSFALGIFSTFILITCLAMLLDIANPGSLSDALTYGFLLWLGLNVTAELSGVAWEQRPTDLMWINSGFMLVGILVPIAILTSWPW